MIIIQANSFTKYYDGLLFTQPTITYTGISENDFNSLSGTLVFLGISSAYVGTYTIQPSGLTSSIYTINYINGTLIILPRLLFIQLSDCVKTYDASNNFNYEINYSDLLINDTLSGQINIYGSRSNVGTYTITISGLYNPNYEITYLPSSLTILPAVLYVISTNQTIIYTGQTFINDDIIYVGLYDTISNTLIIKA